MDRKNSSVMYVPGCMKEASGVSGPPCVRCTCGLEVDSIDMIEENPDYDGFTWQAECACGASWTVEAAYVRLGSLDIV